MPCIEHAWRQACTHQGSSVPVWVPLCLSLSSGIPNQHLPHTTPYQKVTHMATNSNGSVTWTRRPPLEQMPLRYQLLRVPPNGATGLVVLSHDVVGATLHYWRGRTRPCLPANCSPCEHGNRPRWRGYVAVQGRRTHQIFLLELTPAPMKHIDQYFRAHRTLRGAELSLKRKNGKANGEIFLQIFPPAITADDRPKAPDVKQLLEAMWDSTNPAFDDQNVKRKIREDALRIRPDFADERDAG